MHSLMSSEESLETFPTPSPKPYKAGGGEKPCTYKHRNTVVKRMHFGVKTNVDYLLYAY